MIVRLTGTTVAEIYPDFITTAEDVSKWYSPAYAAASVEAPENVRPGWRYIGGEFLPPQEPEPEISTEQRIALLEADNVLQAAQLKAAHESNKFMEDCMVEMAGILYA